MSDASANGEHGNSSNGTSVYNHLVYRNELLDMYRQEEPDAIASSGTLSQLWRRFIYDRRLFALPVCDITGRFRESTARFYRLDIIFTLLVPINTSIYHFNIFQ